jgi:BioD-like phosphotransacetylase family protein
MGRPNPRHRQATQAFGRVTTGVTFDAGGLIALDRGDRRVLVLLARATEVGAHVTVPATALAQAIRRPERQARLARMIRQPGAAVVPLDRVDATSVGRLLSTSGTADIADAHVVICARRASQQVVTSDPDDLRRLDPMLELVVV